LLDEILRMLRAPGRYYFALIITSNTLAEFYPLLNCST
jgi:hypothetical protein